MIRFMDLHVFFSMATLVFIIFCTKCTISIIYLIRKKLDPHNIPHLYFIASIHFIEVTIQKRLDFFELQSGQPCEKPATHLARIKVRIEPGTSRV